MWNTLMNLLKKHLDSKTATDKFGQRIALFAIAIGVHDGLSMLSTSVDELTKAMNNHGGDMVRAAETLGDAIQVATRHLGE